MESLRRLTSSIFESNRRGSVGAGLLSPTSEAAALAAQRMAPTGLDMTFITDRLVAMGFPVQGPTDKKRNQNNIDDLAEYLETLHSNQYLIFNLNALDDDLSGQVQVQDLESFVSTMPGSATTFNSERRRSSVSVAGKVRQQMVEFTWERDGMKAHTPPFDLIFRICYAIFAWLSLDGANVALLNCQTGKTRTGIIVACYLLYARLADDPTEALVEFYRKRWDMRSLTADALRQKTPPSIHRFLTCFHDLIENQRVPNDKPLLLKAVIIRGVPVAYQPCIQIWDDYRIIYCTNDAVSDAPSPSPGPVVDWDSEDCCLAILWEDGLDVDGGFSILCSFGDEYGDDDVSSDPSDKVLFRYADSTWFLAPGLITLTKSKLDMMKQFEEAFEEESFSMDLVFVESKKSPRQHAPIDCTGNTAVRQGVIEISKHHLVLPDPGMHSNFIKMGFSDTATTFALQRSQNAPNIALDLLHSSVLSTCFPQVHKEETSPTARPRLQSSSSVQSVGSGTSTSPTRLVRRQSTAEIAALQSQRSRYSTPIVVDASSLCEVCKDDDYMMRPQIVCCTGLCGKFYHTTCVGLKRIPFGLTTLSDRTNHSVYVKKYFSAWECDQCAAARCMAENSTANLHTSTGSHNAARTYRSTEGHTNANQETTAITFQQNDATGGTVVDEKMDKLKEFLAISGVSVEDLLRAATTTNVAITPPPSILADAEVSEQPAPTSSQTAKSSDVAQRSAASNKTEPVEANTCASERIAQPVLQLAAQDLGNPQEDIGSDGKFASPRENNQVNVSGNGVQVRDVIQHDVHEKQATTSDTFKATSNSKTKKDIDPKSTLLAQISSRKKENTNDDTSFRQVSSSINASDSVPLCESSVNKSITSEPSKYQRMLQHGVPFEAVQSCMRQDGADPSTLTRLPERLEQEQPNCTTPQQMGTKLKDMEEYRSYFNMLRLGCPQEAVKQKMRMDGADPLVIDLGPDTVFESVKDQIKHSDKSSKSSLQDDIKSVRSDAQSIPPTEPSSRNSATAQEISSKREDEADSSPSGMTDILLKNHEVYGKYFKMLKMGLPEDAVRHKMQLDGADVRALELGEDAPASALLESSGTCLRDDPIYSKYFKMLKMGLPVDAVRHKMLAENVNPRALDLGPDALVSQLKSQSKDAKVTTHSPSTKPMARRKKLHWQPISEDRLSSINRQTIWEDKDDNLGNFDMDMDELESLFFAAGDSTKKKKVGPHQPKTLKRKQSVTLIDGKRAMNAAISLARIKLTYTEIAEAIRTFSPSGLTLNQLRGIREFLPTAEEVDLVKKYTGDAAILGEAEKFIREISQVKRYTNRTECLLFWISFEPRRNELNVSLGNLIEACQQVKGSRLLKILLSVVLKLGNTLNGSGEDNGIRGFTVDSLLRLGHTKAVNQKTTVLHYLVRLIKKNHPAVLDFQAELRSVPLAARETFETVDEDFGKLQLGLTQLSEEFQDLQKDDFNAQTEKTIHLIQDAVEKVGSEMEKLEKDIKRARDEVQSVLEYFGEDSRKNPSEFFSTLSSFCTMFETARKEVDAADEASLRAERLKVRRNVSMRPAPSTSSQLNAVARLNGARERAMSDRGLVNDREGVHASGFHEI